jgi:hypothetical protein
MYNTREGTDLRLAWACEPGHSYVVQTNPVAGTGIGGAFGDFSPTTTVPTDYTAPTTNYVHSGALTSRTALYYRIKQFP